MLQGRSTERWKANSKTTSCPTSRGRVIIGILLNLLAVYFSPSEAASPNGTTIPSAPQILDSANNTWAAANGVFTVNGHPITSTITILLLYFNDTIYARNSDTNWYIWHNGWAQVAGDPRGVTVQSDSGPSSSGTTMPPAAAIVDREGNTWTPANNFFYLNGNPITSTITRLLLYYNDTLYASNADGNWYSWHHGWRHKAGDPRSTTTTTTGTDLTGYHLTFSDDFTSNTASDSANYDGAKWYTHAIQCCMSTSDGAGTAMNGLADNPNPYALMPGGGLRIRLQKINNHWTSGVMSSVDNYGKGFAQQYGYFDMSASFPPGNDTWPAFWMLNSAAKQVGAPAGEIDIVEYIANPGFMDYIRSTLHDWRDGSAPAWSANSVSPIPADGNFHTYGLLWTQQTMTFTYDGKVMLKAPTPDIMQQPYYLIVDLGIGAGWPTDATPPVNDMIVKHIRAYALPGQ